MEQNCHISRMAWEKDFRKSIENSQNDRRENTFDE